MVKSARLRALEAGIREHLEPVLQHHGFRYNAARREFSRESGSCLQLVEVQPGVRSGEGTFTVNLAVFHPRYHDPGSQPAAVRAHDCPMEFRRRLGTLRTSWRTGLFRRLLQSRDGWLSWRLKTTADKWWRFSDDPAVVRRSLAEVLRLLEAEGLMWLEESSDEELLRAAHTRSARKGGER